MKNEVEIKTICKVCAGVIDGDITDSETGEYPCYCDKKIVNKTNADKDMFWENGRQKYND